MSDLQQYMGSCLCGAVTYQIDGPIGDIIQCHCQKCRKANGTAYATNAPIAKADFKLTSGQDVVKNMHRVQAQSVVSVATVVHLLSVLKLTPLSFTVCGSAL